MSKATKAISYLRYSSKKQKEGGSEKRQDQWTKEYCEEKGLELVDTYKDLGISAHRGKHSKQGNLARLLDDCHSGKIPAGYALIIENFDRLSREEVPIALQRFLTLINDYKLEIHTLDDARIYAPGKIDLTELIITIVIMGRAHSESARKSVFLTKAWKQKREAKRAYSKPGLKPMGRHPNWLDWDADKQKWIVKDSAASIIEYIFDLAVESELGRYQIAQRLNHEKVPLFSPTAKKWSGSMIKRISENRSLLGEFVPSSTKDTKAEVIKNYYPQVITYKMFEDCAKKTKKRNPHPSGRPVKVPQQYSILSGVGTYLGGGLKKGTYKSRPSGEIVPTYTARVEEKNLYLGRADHIEHFICSLIAELDDEELSVNTQNKAHIIALEKQLESEQQKLKDLLKTKNNFLEAIKIADSSLPELVVQMQGAQQETLICKEEIEDLKKELLDIETGSGVHNREEVVALKKMALEAKDFNARQDMQIALKQLITKLDLAKKLQELPIKYSGVADKGVILDATVSPKFWALIELFNGSLVLGAMTADGQIVRLRWEE